MFDKLIESEPEGAEFKNRRSYFLTSSVVVGFLFLTAVVISIYAADFGLGKDGLELTEMIAPVDMATTEPAPPKPRIPTSSSREQTKEPSRTINMSRVDEPTIVPTTTSVAPNAEVSRPTGKFNLGPVNADTTGSIGSGRPDSTSCDTGTGLTDNPTVAEDTKIPEPPTIVKIPVIVKNPPVQSLGVINGKATNLPKPQYSAAAIAVRAQGKVDVQVMIDESGRVISANAVSGHPLLRSAAEQAARNARFSPTFLSKVPVKVTGVIIYNFMR